MIDTREPNRGYPVPQGENPATGHPGNDIADDMARIRQAIEAIGVDIDSVIEGLGSKASTAHEHAIAEIVGLVGALAGKAAADHAHALAGLSDVSIAGAAAFQVLALVDGAWRNWTIDLAHAIGDAFIRSDVAQDIGDAARARARTNIGAAPVTDPALKGAPTTTTPASTANDERIANTAWVRARISELVGTAPAVIDTIAELATSLANDPNFAVTMATALGRRVSVGEAQAFTAAEKAMGRGNLGVGSIATRALTVSADGPSGGADGDVWLKI